MLDLLTCDTSSTGAAVCLGGHETPYLGPRSWDQHLSATSATVCSICICLRDKDVARSFHGNAWRPLSLNKSNVHMRLYAPTLAMLLDVLLLLTPGPVLPAVAGHPCTDAVQPRLCGDCPCSLACRPHSLACCHVDAAVPPIAVLQAPRSLQRCMGLRAPC